MMINVNTITEVSGFETYRKKEKFMLTGIGSLVVGENENENENENNYKCEYLELYT